MFIKVSDLEAIINIAVLAAFAAILIGLGAAGYRSSRKSFADYAIAGGALGILSLYFYLTWAILSAFTVMGYIGTAYRTGVAYIFSPFPGVIGDMIALLFFGVWFIAYRQLFNAVTPAQALGIRYQSDGLRVLVASVWFVFVCPYIALQNAAVARLMTPLFGFPYEWGLAFCMSVVLIYLLLGGARAAAWTSIVMGVVATVGFLLPIVYIATIVISPASAFTIAGSEWWTVPGPAQVYSPTFAVSFALFFGMTCMGWPHRALIAMSAQNKKILKLTAALLLPTHVLMFSVGTLIALLFAKALVPSLTGAEADAAYMIMIQRFCPPGFDLLYFFVVMSGALTTAAAQTLLCGSFFANDIYSVLRRKASQKELLYVSSITSVAAAFISLAWAILSPVSVGLFLTNIASPGLGIAVPVMIGMLWKRASKEAGIIGLTVGIISSIAAFIHPQIYEWFPYPQAMHMILGLIAWFVVCLFVKTSEEINKKYVDEVKAWIEKST